jgi:hypothetical protein
MQHACVQLRLVTGDPCEWDNASLTGNSNATVICAVRIFSVV